MNVWFANKFSKNLHTAADKLRENNVEKKIHKISSPNQKIYYETTFAGNNKRNNCVNRKCNYQNIYRFYLYSR